MWYWMGAYFGKINLQNILGTFGGNLNVVWFQMTKKCITRNNEYYKLIRNSSVNCLIFSVLCIIHWYHACYFTYLIISVQYTHRTRLSTRINSPITIDYHSGNSAIICLLICLCFLTFYYVHALLL